MPLTLMEMSLGKVFISRTEGSVTNTEFLILTPQHWAKLLGFVSLLLRPDAWAFEATANIIVSTLLSQ